MLKNILESYNSNKSRIETWLAEKIIQAGVHPFYASCDFRNTGKKIVIVDTNLFPAGFNNICKKFLCGSIPLIQNYFTSYFNGVKRIGILTEEHTRNTFYLENVSSLAETIHDAGFSVVIFSTVEELVQKQTEVDCVIINNDFSAGIPPLLSQVEIPLIPPPQAGWHARRKSNHFNKLRSIIIELAGIIRVDPWFLFAETTVVDNIDISSQNSRTILAQKAAELLATLERRHKKFGISETPYLFMKDDSGTYGMGITTITDPAEILVFNKKRRDTFKFGKNKKPISNILLQEGLTSSERIKGLVSEPVVYVINHRSIGGFFRMHETADERSSLNRPGMQFTKLCFHELEEYRNLVLTDCNAACLESLYSTLASCASIAASEEIRELLEKRDHTNHI